MAKPGVDFPGVGCGLVIQRADGRVLLCKRLKVPEAGFWNIVGGKVDMMEHSADAARREAEEESGLKIGAVPADGQHWVSLMYLTRDFTGEPSLTEPDKLSDIGWFDLDDLPQPLSAFSVKAFAALKTQSVPA